MLTGRYCKEAERSMSDLGAFTGALGGAVMHYVAGWYGVAFIAAIYLVQSVYWGWRADKKWRAGANSAC